MKKSLFTILILLTLTACGAEPTTTTSHNPPSEPPVVEPPPPEPQTKIVAIYNQSTNEFGFSDGTIYNSFGQGSVFNAHDNFFSVDDVLHGIDTETGESIISQRLPCTPSAVAISADTWSFQVIPPLDAFNMGEMFRTYTQIWKNGTEYGLWTDNQWEAVDALVTESGAIIAVDVIGKFRNIETPTMLVHYAEHNGLLIHGVEQENNRAYISDRDGTTRVAFLTNYFFSARHWQKTGGVWHSWNGYTWNGTVLEELDTSLSDFTQPVPESPYIVTAGVIEEHSEQVSYWIDCNSGWLYRHTPSIDSTEKVIQLYQGSGLRSDGILNAVEINPVMTTQGLFYKYDGTVWKYDFTTISSFAGDVVVWGM